MSASETVHATCVALGKTAVLLTGRSGAGKSDLALRLIDRGWMLVSDDYTIVTARDGIAHAAAPATIAGRMEVRGVGIVTLPACTDIPVVLLCVLDAPVDRLPDPATRTVAGIALPALNLAAIEPSAPLKLEHALRRILDR